MGPIAHLLTDAIGALVFSATCRASAFKRGICTTHILVTAGAAAGKSWKPIIAAANTGIVALTSWIAAG